MKLLLIGIVLSTFLVFAGVISTWAIIFSAKLESTGTCCMSAYLFGYYLKLIKLDFNTTAATTTSTTTTTITTSTTANTMTTPTTTISTTSTTSTTTTTPTTPACTAGQEGDSCSPMVAEACCPGLSCKEQAGQLGVYKCEKACMEEGDSCSPGVADACCPGLSCEEQAGQVGVYKCEKA